MGLSNRYKKRILIFSVIPILTVIPFLTENFILRIITAILGVIYVGVIIFLRDSRSDIFREKFEYGNEDEDYSSEPGEYSGDDVDSSWEIISQNKDIKIAGSEEIVGTGKYEPEKLIIDPELKKNYTKIANEKIPSNINDNKKFEFILEKFLQIIKSSFDAYTVLFMWYDEGGKEFTPENYISETRDVALKPFILDDDHISKIVKGGEPLFIHEFNPVSELDNLPYYVKPQEINSFLGVPVFYGKTLAGVIALDSKNKNAFSLDTVYALGRIVRVISMLITVFDKRFSDSLAEKRLSAITSIFATEKKYQGDKDLVEMVEGIADKILDWDAFVFIRFNPEKQSFNTTRVILREDYKYVGENLEIDLENTFTGKAIMTGLPVKIDDVKSKKFKRFSASEDISYDGSFLAIPLVYEEQNYGVLCFEKRKKNFYTNGDVSFMRSSTKIISFFLYTFATQKIMNSLIALDPETRTLNSNSFFEQVTADMFKAEKAQLPSALALVRIDDFLDQGTLFDDSLFPKVLMAVAEEIQLRITPAFTLGRLDEKVFGVYHFNANSKDMHLWGEKLKTHIARKQLAVISKQKSFTVSIGVASAFKKTDLGEVLQNAQLALGKAIEKGGNTVKSLN